MSYLTQMAGLALHNFVSAATGIAIAIALVRGLARRWADSIGNFWVDLVRVTLYVLLPDLFVFALVLVWQGVPQNLNAYTAATTLEGATQTIAQGRSPARRSSRSSAPTAAASSTPTRPTRSRTRRRSPTSSRSLAIFAIPAGLTYTFGRMVGDTRQGWALWAAMTILFLAGVAVVLPVEQSGNPLLTQLGVDQRLSDLQAGGNIEGKEIRFGIAASALCAVITTAASCGAVNAMHDSFMPLAGMIPMLNMQLGEVVFGGVGAGLYGMLMFAILAVFIAGLMVGRTPEYLGKKIEAFEMKMAMLAVLVLARQHPRLHRPRQRRRMGHGDDRTTRGPHGFSEILYAFTLGDRQQRLGLRRASARTRSSTTRRSAWRC